MLITLNLQHIISLLDQGLYLYLKTYWQQFFNIQFPFLFIKVVILIVRCLFNFCYVIRPLIIVIQFIQLFFTSIDSFILFNDFTIKRKKKFKLICIFLNNKTKSGYNNLSNSLAKYMIIKPKC